MNISDPYLNLLALIAMFTFGLLGLSCLPWCLAAAVQARAGTAAQAKQTIRQLTTAASLILWLALLLRPQAVAAGPPGFSWIEPVLADPGLASFSPLGVLVVRAALIAECVLGLVTPVMLIVLALAFRCYVVALAPIVALTKPWACHLMTRGQRREEQRRAAEAERQRRQSVARMQAAQQRAEQAQQAVEHEKEAVEKARKAAARRQAISRLTEALEELPSLPDTRRATLVAQEAEILRRKHRQELAQLYRGEITRHAAVRLQRGERSAKVQQSVADLLAALAVPGADHEAAYILAEAGRQLPSATEKFRQQHKQQLEELMEQHRIRVQAINDLQLDDLEQEQNSLAERLLEQEREQFKKMLLQLNPCESDTMMPELKEPFAPFSQPEAAGAPRQQKGPSP